MREGEGERERERERERKRIYSVVDSMVKKYSNSVLFCEWYKINECLCEWKIDKRFIFSKNKHIIYDSE